MSVEVEIYMSNLIKFFKTNPNDLINLIPKEKEKEFFEKIKKTAQTNLTKGLDVTLSKNQIIEICLEINRKPQIGSSINNLFQETKFGKICLN